MSDTKTKIMDRIAALLALADGNTNEHEASAAMAAANRLMAQHEIDRASVAMHSAEPDMEDVTIEDEILDTLGAAVVPTWLWHLAYGIASVHGCYCYVSSVLNRDVVPWKRTKRIMILGTKTDAGAARYVHAYAARQIEAACREAMKGPGSGGGRTWATNFRLGAADRVVARYREAHRKNVAEVRATATGSALVRVDETREAKALALRSAVKARRFVSSGSGGGSRYDEHARAAGRAAGDRVDIGSGSSRGSLGAGAQRLGGGR